MKFRTLALIVAVNLLLSAAMLGVYAHWFAPTGSPRLAVLDVGELYRLKESQVAKLLVKHDASEADRAQALAQATAFGRELDRLLESLSEACHCLVLARGAIVGPAALLPDLTPEVRRRLGL